jgi:iron complex transport system substrate-binding protein
VYSPDPFPRDLPRLASTPVRRGLGRRRAALLAALVLAGTLLAGCASDGDADAAPLAGETRTVRDVDGASIEVPADPQRVVALSEPTLDGILALGVTPVGTITGRGQSTVPHYLADLAGDIPILGGVAQPDYEAIADVRPDLILVDGTSINNNPEAMEVLGQIAPTVSTGLAGGDWRSNLDLVADALNRVEEGAEVQADYDAQVAAATERLGAYAEDTFSVVRWQGGSAALVLEELPAGTALNDLGLARPAAQDRRGRGHSEPVALENLDDIDADYMFFGTLGGSSVGNNDAGGSSDVGAAEQALATAVQVPGFASLEAYRDDHIIPVDGSLWTSTGGPLLMSRLVDSVLEALA